jgi:hypothetical protein
MEEVKRLTTVTMSEAELRERHQRDKDVLQENLRRVLRERNDLKKRRMDLEAQVAFRGVLMTYRNAITICANDVLTLSAQLRNVKSKL